MCIRDRLTIDTLITQVNESNDPALVAGLGDKLAKLSAVSEKLDKKANVVDVIEVFMAFSKWIEYRSTIDPEVTPELVRGCGPHRTGPPAFRDRRPCQNQPRYGVLASANPVSAA